MYRNRVGHFGRGNNCGDIQIAVGARGRANTDRLVRQGNMFQVSVDCRVHRDGFDSHGMTGTYDSQCNFTAVGDDNLFN